MPRVPVTPPPPADVDVDDTLVTALLRQQHPDLAERPLRRVAAGWDNAMWRLGDDLAVRMPRRAVAAPLVEKELRWLPDLADRLPLPVPVPVRRGEPSGAYPWPWAVCRWIEGLPAADAAPLDGRHTADVLGGFLRALHRTAPHDAPRNPVRGVPLIGRDDAVRQRLEQLADVIDAGPVLAVWEEALSASDWEAAPRWIHGDLHPMNVIVRDGSLAGVIDFGDVAAGDPSTDLAVAWMLLADEAHRERLRSHLDGTEADEATWRRGRGWAVALGLAYLAHSEGRPAMERIGRAALAAAVDDLDRG